jgi:uncharacterized protein
VAIMNLIRLAGITTDARYLERAHSALSAFAPVMHANPMAVGEMLMALDDFHHPPPQIIVIHPDNGQASDVLESLRARFLPGSMLLVLNASQAAGMAKRLPVMAEKTALGGRTTAYVCRKGACRLPVSDAAGLAGQLDERSH